MTRQAVAAVEELQEQVAGLVGDLQARQMACETGHVPAERFAAVNNALDATRAELAALHRTADNAIAQVGALTETGTVVLARECAQVLVRYFQVLDATLGGAVPNGTDPLFEPEKQLRAIADEVRHHLDCHPVES